MSGKQEKRLRKATKLTMQQLRYHTGELKNYANALPLHRRAKIAAAILIGRW
jgi:hypothetical protein